MAKSKTLFDPGKILLLAERMLETALVSLETFADKKLLRNSSKGMKQKKKIEPYEFVIHDFDDGRLEKEPEINRDELISERINELEQISNDHEQEQENDHERD